MKNLSLPNVLCNDIVPQSIIEDIAVSIDISTSAERIHNLDYPKADVEELVKKYGVRKIKNEMLRLITAYGSDANIFNNQTLKKAQNPYRFAEPFVDYLQTLYPVDEFPEYWV